MCTGGVRCEGVKVVSGVKVGWGAKVVGCVKVGWRCEGVLLVRS